jgi:hypothetical protein
MPIRQTAYETTACNGFVIHKIQHAVEDALVTANVSRSEGNSKLLEVQRSPSASPIPSFFHPVTIKEPNGFSDTPVGGHTDSDSKEPHLVAIDVRSCGKFDEHEFKFLVRSRYEYDFTRLYGRLTEFWVNENPRLLASVSNLPVALYARWLSENITRRFGLSPQDQMTSAIVAAYFYLGQFTNDEKPDDRELQRICAVISKSVYVPAQNILDVIGDRSYIKSIAEFCEVLKEVTGNVRLNDLNTGVVFSMIGNTWYGTNAKELAAVALEFPPAWILLTYSSYMDRGYKNTGIAKLSARDKAAEISSFTKSLVGLLAHHE